jgi:hypothetical protein
MSESSGTEDDSTLVLRISIPAGAEYRAIVTEMAAKVAAYFGDIDREGADAAAAIGALAAKVTAGGDGGDVEATFEFRKSDDSLLMRARCDGRTAVVTRPLPSRT